MTRETRQAMSLTRAPLYSGPVEHPQAHRWLAAIGAKRLYRITQAAPSAAQRSAASHPLPPSSAIDTPVKAKADVIAVTSVKPGIAFDRHAPDRVTSMRNMAK
jgi:hypothetical protein